MRNVVGSPSTPPTGIITYLSKHVIDKIKDIGDITLSLKTCNLERNAFYEGVEFPDDCDVLISYAPPKDESLVASFITQYAVTAYASQRYLEKHPISRPDELEHHSCIFDRLDDDRRREYLALQRRRE